MYPYPPCSCLAICYSHGAALFPRTHPDANGFYVLATLLGGYFGSRLMANVREDKGFTYNISAAYDSQRFHGALQIDTEVSPEHVDATLSEIRQELLRLCEEPVPEEELTMVQNYLMGSYLSMVDGLSIGQKLCVRYW
ncbi:MAG: insulinase family protein [Saprospiraceae bacterium]